MEIQILKKLKMEQSGHFLYKRVTSILNKTKVMFYSKIVWLTHFVNLKKYFLNKENYLVEYSPNYLYLFESTKSLGEIYRSLLT